MDYYLIEGIKIAAGKGMDDFSGMGAGRFDIAAIAHPETDTAVDLKDEISGRTNFFERLTALSCEMDCTAAAGVYLSYGGVRKLSVAIAHRGRPVDIADCCSASAPYSRGGSIRLYGTVNGNIAVLVGGDSRVRFIMEKLAGRTRLALCFEPEYRPENEQRIKKLAQEFYLPLIYISPDCSFAFSPERKSDI